MKIGCKFSYISNFGLTLVSLKDQSCHYYFSIILCNTTLCEGILKQTLCSWFLINFHQALQPTSQHSLKDKQHEHYLSITLEKKIILFLMQWLAIQKEFKKCDTCSLLETFRVWWNTAVIWYTLARRHIPLKDRTTF